MIQRNESINGWGVRVIDNSKVTYGEILESINGADITALKSTFHYCSNLTTAPAIPSTVTSLEGAFYGCRSLETYIDSASSAGDFSGYSLPDGTTNMTNTFGYCVLLERSPAIPDNVVEMSGTYASCEKLAEAPVIPVNVTSLKSTFERTAITTVPIIPSNVTNLSETFSGCTSLTTIPDNFEISSNVESLQMTFYNCSSLTGTIVVKTDKITTAHTGPEPHCNQCFAGTTLPITLVGTGNNDNVLELLAGTSGLFNVTY